MMPLVIDHNANIDRIIEIIKANPKLFKESKPKGLLRDVFFAEPDADIQDKPAPYCYVSLSKRFQYTREDIGTEEEEFNQTIAEYQITVIHQDASRERTQRALYPFFDEIVNSIKANPRLADPADGITDPKCIRTKILPAEQKDFGTVKEKLGFAITLQCQIGSHYLLTLPGLADMPVLDKPIESEIETVEDIYNAARIRKRAAPVDETHSSFYSIEYTQARMDQLRTLKRARSNISFTLKRGAASETRTGRLIQIRNGAPFDRVETIVLQIEVFN